MRIAWFTPWSSTIPLRSAVISAASVNALSGAGGERWEIELFLGDDDLEELVGTNAFPGHRCSHYLQAAERHRRSPFDLFIYNIEDHPRCRFIAEFHHTLPGIILAHDINLNRLSWAKFAHTTAPTEINSEMDALFGTVAPRLGDAFVRGWPLEAYDRIYRRGALQLNRTPRLMVSDSFLLRSLDSDLCSRSTVISFPLQCFAVAAADRGVGGRFMSRETVVVAGDSLARTQLSTIFRALLLQRERLEGYRILLLEAATEVNARAPWCPATEFDLPVEHHVAASVEEYQAILAAASLVLVPGADEYRGLPFSAATAIASGKPTILSPIGGGEGIPADVAVKTARIYCGDAGHIDDAELLSRLIVEVLDSPQLAAVLAENAKRWVAAERSTDAFCSRLRQMIKQEHMQITAHRRTTERQYQAAQAMHVHSLMERLNSSDLWRETPDSETVLVNSVLKTTVRDFGWLDAPVPSGGVG